MEESAFQDRSTSLRSESAECIARHQDKFKFGRQAKFCEVGLKYETGGAINFSKMLFKQGKHATVMIQTDDPMPALC
jgi:hypothetical protein